MLIYNPLDGTASVGSGAGAGADAGVGDGAFTVHSPLQDVFARVEEGKMPSISHGIYVR